VDVKNLNLVEFLGMNSGYLNKLVDFLIVVIAVTIVILSLTHVTNKGVREIIKDVAALSEKVDNLEFDVLIEYPEPPKPQIIKQRDMRVTGYVPTGNKTALGENVVVGKTAAVSRNCMDLLGEKVYIEGYGIRYVNDLTAKWVGEEFGICTIDLAVPTVKHAMQVGNETRKVIHIPTNELN
jgi:3D (Asp-Asp-Asp) domain-containing protein